MWSRARLLVTERRLPPRGTTIRAGRRTRRTSSPSRGDFWSTAWSTARSWSLTTALAGVRTRSPRRRPGSRRSRPTRLARGNLRGWSWRPIRRWTCAGRLLPGPGPCGPLLLTRRRFGRSSTRTTTGLGNRNATMAPTDRSLDGAIEPIGSSGLPPPLRGPRAIGRHRRRTDMARSISRWLSRFFVSSRLSHCCLPWTSASSAFTRPFFS